MSTLKSMMIVSDDYPSEGRPTKIFVEQLVNALVDLGVDVKVVAEQSVTRIIMRRQSILPRYTKMTTNQGNVYEVFRPYGISLGNLNAGKRLVLAYNRWSITRILKKIKVDALYGHFWHNARKVNEYARKNHIPLFVACGEGDEALENMVKSIGGKEKKSLIESITGVISVSSENQRKCLKFGLIDNKNIIILPNCVDTTLFHTKKDPETKTRLGISDGDFTIVFVGGFIPRKGPDRVARAIDLLNDEHVKSIFIGKPFSGYDYDFNCKGIVYKGIANHNEIPNLLGCADVFVLPTQKEGCCNAIVEALACGLPVISSNGPFNDDILDENNSIKVDPMNVEEISNAIAYLRDHPEVRKEMQKVSLARHDQYSIESRAKKIKAFIENRLC